ncbi:MAG: zinc ribbon domain-containing protein, partial [Candidatus Helarchaeota archaeon]
MTNLKEEDYINQIDNEDKADYLEYYDEMTIHYRYSVGELSKFFKEIRDNEKLFGTRCTKCGFGFFPPRLNCHKCYVPCEW